MVTVEAIDFGLWSRCWRIANDHIELVVTCDFGPRVIHFGLVGRENEFATISADWGPRNSDTWRLYGGHRLWHAPEHSVRTYQPDNDPVAVEPGSDGIRLTQQTEPKSGVQKEIDVRVVEGVAGVTLTHRLINRSLWPLPLAPWAITAMAPGGVAIVPHAQRGTWPDDLLPTHTLTLWAFTNMSDPRWTWGEKNVLLRQDPALTSPQKIGIHDTDGWVAYQRAGHLFVKYSTYRPDVLYPDLGSTVEVFANGSFLELETLGPVVHVPPGSATEHIEEWRLHPSVGRVRSEDDVNTGVLPLVQAGRADRASC